MQLPLTQIIMHILHKHKLDTIDYYQSWMSDTETPVLNMN